MRKKREKLADQSIQKAFYPYKKAEKKSQKILPMKKPLNPVGNWKRKIKKK